MKNFMLSDGFLFLLVTFFVSQQVNSRPVSLLDLTHEMSNETLSYPTHVKFQILNRRHVDVGNGIKFATGEFLSSEHSGTHMDAPIHFADGVWAINEIPIDHFEGPGVVINITEKASSNPDSEVLVQDLKDWESLYGRIPEGSIILMNSGYGKHFWTNATAYFGTATGDVYNMHFPGFNATACKWLVEERDIVGIGVDTVSGDYGKSLTFPCHNVLSKNNKFVMENVANIDKLPEKGSFIRAYPLKLKGGTGCPARIIATLPV